MTRPLPPGQRNAADDRADNGVKFIVLSVGDGDRVESGHQDEAAERSQNAAQQERAELIGLDVDAGEECRFTRAADGVEVTADAGLGSDKLRNCVDDDHQQHADREYAAEDIAAAKERDTIGHVGNRHSRVSSFARP